MSHPFPEEPHAPLSSRGSESRMDRIRKLKLETDKLKLLQKLRLQKEVSAQRSMLQMLDEQIESQKEAQREEARNRIAQKIQQNKDHQRIRNRLKAYSDKEVERLKLLKELHDIQNEERIRSINLEKSTEQEKILEHKKGLLKPIEFDKLKMHEQHYRMQKLKKQQSERYFSKDFSLPKLSSRYQPPPIKTKASELVRHEYEDRKHSIINHKTELMDAVAKRMAYGMSAEKKFRHAKIKTQPSKYDQMDEKRQEEQNRRLYQYLSKPRKQPMKFVEGDLVENTKKQIATIKGSQMSFFDKFDILNNLSKGYIEKFDHGKEYAVQLAAEANIALADLFLRQPVQ